MNRHNILVYYYKQTPELYPRKHNNKSVYAVIIGGFQEMEYTHDHGHKDTPFHFHKE